MVMDLSSGHSIQNSNSDKIYQASKDYFSPGKLWQGKKITDKILATSAVISYGTVIVPAIMKGINIGARKYNSSNDLKAKLLNCDTIPSFDSLQKRASNDEFAYKNKRSSHDEYNHTHEISSDGEYTSTGRSSKDEYISSHERASNEEHNYTHIKGIKFIDY
jgi:hypothetical protein